MVKSLEDAPTFTGAPNEICETCIFWGKEYSDTDQMGSCRRNPPSLFSEKVRVGEGGDQRIYRCQWPYTKNIEWCGEWRGL